MSNYSNTNYYINKSNNINYSNNKSNNYRIRVL